MSQQIQIALDPELGLDPEALIAAWNNDAETNSVGKLKPASTGNTVVFHDPHALIVVLETAVVITSGILISLLTDLIKEKYLPQKPEIIEIHQPDGQKIVIVKKK
ncbi:MAG: hypothetical protein DHS20C20_13800 [Ardenticatenaceae bacterium]|nr:MAG: hypothetical protein DHS20C20_13800 [Ardenticatenaceae bacterium]